MDDENQNQPSAKNKPASISGRLASDVSGEVPAKREGDKDSKTAPHTQLPSFETDAIEAAKTGLRPRALEKFRSAVKRPFHLLKHRSLGRSMDGAFDELDPAEKEAIAVTAELGKEALDFSDVPNERGKSEQGK